MNRIKILPQEVYSKIAAGEVIERPSSIVRELIDNAIDADSTEIIIKIEKGGIEKITIIDNGTGINREDLKLAMSMHATSKISSVDDLLNLYSMGFRGEALHSIQTVSKINITTNTDKTGEKPGYKISNFEDPLEIKPTACKKGTKVDVINIFYNIPARKKFLKSQNSEWSDIKKTVYLKALSNLNISFKLYNNEDLSFSTKGDNDFKNAFFSIFKNENSFEINKYIKKINNNLEIELYYSEANVFFSDRKHNILFVNKRPVFLNFIYPAINNGIKNYISPGRYPLIYLYINIAPNLIDINIHPAKREIKFKNQEEIFFAIQTIISEAYSKNLKREIFGENIQNNVFKDKNKEINLFKNDIYENPNFKQLNNEYNKEKTHDENKNIKDYDILGVAFSNYIIVEHAKRLLLVDQHAACEAVIYRKKKEKYSKSKEIEKLIIPVLFELTLWNEKTEDKINQLNNNGFLIEKNEGSTLIIRELPSILLNRKDYNEIIDIIKNILENENNIKEDSIIDDILIESSCKQAVKKGDNLSLLEITEIIDEYFKFQISNCPHGRPSHFEITLDKLEKIFQRKL